MKTFPGDTGPKEYLLDRVRWLIRLRWVAVAGVFCVTYLFSGVLRAHLQLSSAALYSLAGILFFYNAALFFTLQVLTKKGIQLSGRWVDRLANIQISLDLTCLVFLIHFAGGIENPFIFYFIFHMIIASILLSRRAAFSQATYAVVLFFAMVLMEHLGLVHHYCLKAVFFYDLNESLFYIAGKSFVFVSTLYITVYLATSITAQLRARERSLEDVNRLLREKDHIKSEYVLRVTHDIRQDLAAIQSCIEPVTLGITGPLASSQADLLRRAIERSKQLIVYVDALLDITTLKLTQSLKMEPFSLTDLVREISSQISELARTRRLTFEIRMEAASITVLGVRVYLEEALVNLLKNSLKYTPPGGAVLLEVKTQGDRISIRVEDTGIGISPEDLPRIFEEFYRADNAKILERKGTGLGLSIAKQIVEMHRGKIEVESALGKGTTFLVELPLASDRKSPGEVRRG